MTAKTKRDRAAGRAHRHTAIQTIVNNHQGIIDDIASIDNSIAALQGETCDIGTKLVVWTARLEEQNEHTRQNVAYTMRCVVENERKAAEVESAVGILQHTSKEHQEAIAQLVVYTNKVHGKQVALNQEINLLQAEVDDTRAELMTLSKLTIVLGAATLLACLTLFFITITH